MYIFIYNDWVLEDGDCGQSEKVDPTVARNNAIKVLSWGRRDLSFK